MAKKARKAKAPSKPKGKPDPRQTSLMFRAITKADRAHLDKFKAARGIRVDSKAMVQMLHDHMHTVEELDKSQRDLSKVRLIIGRLVRSSGDLDNATKHRNEALKELAPFAMRSVNPFDDDDM